MVLTQKRTQGLMEQNREPRKKPTHIWSIDYSTTKGATQVALVVKNLLGNAGDIREVCLIPGSGRSPGRGTGNPLQYSHLENPTSRGNQWATTVAKSQTQLET